MRTIKEKKQHYATNSKVRSRSVGRVGGQRYYGLNVDTVKNDCKAGQPIADASV